MYNTFKLHKKCKQELSYKQIFKYNESIINKITLQILFCVNIIQCYPWEACWHKTIKATTVSEVVTVKLMSQLGLIVRFIRHVEHCVYLHRSIKLYVPSFLTFYVNTSSDFVMRKFIFFTSITYDIKHNRSIMQWLLNVIIKQYILNVNSLILFKCCFSKISAI